MRDLFFFAFFLVDCLLCLKIFRPPRSRLGSHSVIRLIKFNWQNIFILEVITVLTFKLENLQNLEFSNFLQNMEFSNECFIVDSPINNLFYNNKTFFTVL